MKNLIRGFGIIMIALIFFIASITVYTKDAKTKELKQALTKSMEEAVTNLTIEDLKEDNEADLADYFVAKLASNITSKNKGIDVKIYGINYEEGYIDAEATAHFSYIIGNGETTVRKTMYVDDKADTAVVDENNNSEDQIGIMSIAYEKDAVASSVDSKKHKAVMVTDNDDSTYWESELNVKNIHKTEENITIDFEMIYQVNRFSIEWGDNYAKSYDIEASSDNDKWIKIYETDISNGGIDNIKVDTVACRYIRINLHFKNEQDKGYQIKDIKVYPEHEDAVAFKKDKVKNEEQLLSQNCIIDTNDNSENINNIVDDNDDTKWVSNRNKNIEFIMDLGSVYNISNLEIKWADTMQKEPYYDIKYSEDGKDWKDMYSQSKDKKSELKTNINARYIKFIGNDANNDNFAINSFNVYGKSNLFK